MRIVFLILIITVTGNKYLIGQGIKTDKNNSLQLGGEIGINKITSEHTNRSPLTIQVGLLLEYYFDKSFSLRVKTKYYKTGVSFYVPSTHSGGILDLGHDEYYGTFEGIDLSFLMELKKDFRITNNLWSFIKIGFGYRNELKSNYLQYSRNLDISEYKKNSSLLNIGNGCEFKICEKMTIYTELEYYRGTSKGESKTFWSSRKYRTSNLMTNLGVKRKLF